MNKDLLKRCQTIQKTIVKDNKISIGTLRSELVKNKKYQSDSILKQVLDYYITEKVCIMDGDKVSKINFSKDELAKLDRMIYNINKQKSRSINKLTISGWFKDPLRRKIAYDYVYTNSNFESLDIQQYGISKDLYYLCINVYNKLVKNNNIDINSFITELKSNQVSKQDIGKAIEFLKTKYNVVFTDSELVAKENFTSDEIKILNKLVYDFTTDNIRITPNILKNLFSPEHLELASKYLIDRKVMSSYDTINFSISEEDKKLIKNDVKDFEFDDTPDEDEEFEDEIIDDDFEDPGIDNEDELFTNNPNITISDSVKSYLNAISKFKLLDPDEEKDLAYKIRNKDSAAREKLIKHNLRLVVSIAKHYVNYTLPIMDLIQYGNMGLMNATDRFDPDKGYRFSTYATWWIKQSILRGIENDARIIRVPVHAVEQATKNRKARVQLMELLGRTPTEQEWLDYINDNKIYCTGVKKITLDDLHRYEFFYDNTTATISLETPIGEEEDSTLGDFIINDSETPEQTAIKTLQSEAIYDVMNKILSRKEKEILILRFGLKDNRTRTLEEIAKLYNVTRERIRQIESKALRKLRNSGYSKRILSNF